MLDSLSSIDALSSARRASIRIVGRNRSAQLPCKAERGGHENTTPHLSLPRRFNRCQLAIHRLRDCVLPQVLRNGRTYITRPIFTASSGPSEREIPWWLRVDGSQLPRRIRSMRDRLAQRVPDTRCGDEPLGAQTPFPDGCLAPASDGQALLTP